MRYSELLEAQGKQKKKKFSDLIDYDILTSGNNIDITYNALTELTGSPDIIIGNFDCQGNKLNTLIGGPKFVGGSFDCFNNPLTSLIGSPEIIGSGPNGGEFCFGSPSSKITLLGITTKKINGLIYGEGKVTGLMSLWKIKGITTVSFPNIPDSINGIINKYITNPRGALAFQAEIISSGYKEYL